jgi:hypothetical protein
MMSRLEREERKEASKMKVLEKLCDVKRQHEIVKNIENNRKERYWNDDMTRRRNSTELGKF